MEVILRRASDSEVGVSLVYYLTYKDAIYLILQHKCRGNVDRQSIKTGFGNFYTNSLPLKTL
jgi:hypothetical protein